MKKSLSTASKRIHWPGASLKLFVLLIEKQEESLEINQIKLHKEMILLSMMLRQSWNLLAVLSKMPCLGRATQF